MNKKHKIIVLSSGLAMVGVGLLVIQLGFAWTNPTAAPFGGNPPPPVQLQGATPGTVQTGNINISGTGLFGGNVGIGMTGPTARLHVQGVGTTTAATVNITDSAGASRLFVRDDGNVGIGTTAPGARLHVAGMVRADSFQTTGGSGLRVFTVSGTTSATSWVTDLPHPTGIDATNFRRIHMIHCVVDTATASPEGGGTGTYQTPYWNSTISDHWLGLTWWNDRIMRLHHGNHSGALNRPIRCMIFMVP